MYSTNEEGIIVALVLLVLYLIILGLGIACYVMNAVALQTLGKRRMMQYPWMAWLPFASLYLLGSLVDDYDERNGIKRKWKITLLVLGIVAVGVLVVAYFGLIAWVMTITIFGVEYPTVDPSAVLSGLAVIYIFLIVAMSVAMTQAFCKAICIYKIFESTVPEKAVKYLLLTLLVPMAQSICLMRCRNKGYSKEWIHEPTYPAYPSVEQDTSTEEHTKSNNEL